MVGDSTCVSLMLMPVNVRWLSVFPVATGFANPVEDRNSYPWKWEYMKLNRSFSPKA